MSGVWIKGTESPLDDIIRTQSQIGLPDDPFYRADADIVDYVYNNNS